MSSFVMAKADPFVWAIFTSPLVFDKARHAVISAQGLGNYARRSVVAPARRSKGNALQ